MNRIVKSLDYKPIGSETSTLAFNAVASEGLGTGLYLIPRYSFMNVNGTYFSLNKDVAIAKNTLDQEDLTEFSNQNLLFQGRYYEYPNYTAEGNENEVIYISLGDRLIIDHFNIDVYVKSKTGKWEQWTRTNSLYLENSISKKYEVRFNENKNYEIKFGNGVNGQKLLKNDEVAIYFLESNGTTGEVGVGAIDAKSLLLYNTTRFNGDQGIIQDVVFDYNNSVINSTDLSYIVFSNNENSTFYNEEETVEDVRDNAPGVFRSQYRLVTQLDYENYIKANFSQLVHDVKTVNNWQYVSDYLRYLYDLGLTNPNKESRVLYNQVYFGDSCNFNNIYAFVIPKTVQESFDFFNFLKASQKEFIQYNIRDQKTLSTEVVLMDPVYMSVGFLVPKIGVDLNTADLTNNKLTIVKNEESRRNDTSITKDVVNVFKNYFSRENLFLGQVIDVNLLTKELLDISGVKTFYTTRTDDTTINYEGLSLAIWNPIYLNDFSLTTKNTTLPYFKVPFLNDFNNFENYIEVVADQRIYESIEY
jgi:hypothetical protein